MQPQLRSLTLGLIFSGALNIALLITLVFSALPERQESERPSSQSAAAEQVPNYQVWEKIEKLSFRELVAYLTNRDLLEDGYRMRDLALAGLVAFHDFHIEKALSGAPLQKREWKLSQGKKVSLFPGLGDTEFQHIIRFAYEEKWPLTGRGLFRLLAVKGEDEGVKSAFCQTSEFERIRLFFQQSGSPLDSATLLGLLCEGTWEVIERFILEQEQLLDFSAEKRQAFLLSFLRLQSKKAAELLIRTDYPFCLKKLTDAGLIMLASLLQEKSPEAERFCKDILAAPRADAVWRVATQKLFFFEGKPLSEDFDLKAAIEELKGEVPKVASPAILPLKTQTAPTLLYHVVGEGESLWKIARQYKVKVDELVALNNLEKDRLYPGMTLKIPQRVSAN